MLISDIAEDLFQHIFERDQSSNGSELIDHESHVGVVDAEFINELIERLGFRHNQGLAKEAAQAEGPVARAASRERSGAPPKRA